MGHPVFARKLATLNSNDALWVTQAANTGYSTYERHYDDTPHYEYHHDDHDEVIDFDVNVDNRDQDRYRQNGSNRGRKNNGHRGGRHRPHHYRNKRGAWDRADRGEEGRKPSYTVEYISDSTVLLGFYLERRIKPYGRLTFSPPLVVTISIFVS